MTIDVVIIPPLIALIAGLLILMVPRMLNYLVAIYLIVAGVVGLLPLLDRNGSQVSLDLSLPQGAEQSGMKQ
jgi:hypothetical protein